MLRAVLFTLALLLLAGCAVADRLDGGPLTPPASPTTRAPTQTPTPTITPTPTATAPPAVVAGDPRVMALADPIRQAGAPCGFVDVLDFPLDPPDGEAATGGTDFGRFRSRFDGYHAGEDWRVGGSSFGKPVYAVGHGRVIYAQPLGWGADKGVIIMEHLFRDGRRLLSFYGHLHPPSVLLRPGACVERGDEIAAIGDPRSPPHLHFEIRVHLPDTPGPGYWPVDPTLAGWRPPSATIWSERISALPGVRWAFTQQGASLEPLGVVDGTVLVYLEGGELLALDVLDGRTRWSQTLPETASSLLLDSDRRLMYVAAAGGMVEAFHLADFEGGDPLDPLWQAEVGLAGVPELAPLPGGGLVAVTRETLTAISAQGDVLWREDSEQGVVDGVHSDGALILLTGDRLWIIDNPQATSWPLSIRGRKLVAGDELFVYADDGLYRLDAESRGEELFLALPAGFPRAGDLVSLPDGGLLMAHLDLDDKRLIAVEADGALRWERSIASLQARTVDLLVVADQAYLLTNYDVGRANGIDIFHVDETDGRLTRVFSGGSRASSGSGTTILLTGESALIAIDGVGLFAWEPAAALGAILGE